MLASLRAYGRFAWGLPGFLRRPLSLPEARAGLAARLAGRETAFVEGVERAIFGNPRSPYLPLFRLADCGPQDVRRLVQDRGLEGALEALRAAGIYVAFEEFKGRRPIVRGGRESPVRTADFDNPRLKRFLRGQTGGTTGPVVRTAVDLDHLREQAGLEMLALAAHGVLDAPTAVWRTILPSTAGLNTILKGPLIGRVPERWFCPLTHRQLRPSLKDRLATGYILAVGRLSGAPLPRPEFVALDDAHIVLDWLVSALQAHGRCVLRAHVSMLLRVALAARERSTRLTGAVFMGGGEPPTPTKVAEIENAGARFIPTYFFAETGAVGFGCARPAGRNDVHFQSDALAVIRHPRPAPGTTSFVDALLFTTLLPHARKILLNVENDDYAILESRACGCPFEDYGLTLHLRDIQSFSKLTGEGVTLAGGELVRILEQVLPTRFGGTPLDYQLLEEEDSAGFTRLALLVHPRLSIADEDEIQRVVSRHLRGKGPAANFAGAVWEAAGTLRVRREAPRLTSQGKFIPLVKTMASPAGGGATARGPAERSG